MSAAAQTKSSFDTKSLPPDWLVGGGEMGDAVRAFDWAKTPLGSRMQWPQSLRSAVALSLNSRFPMFVWWGVELINIYNDAYAPLLGTRHPGALGRPAPDTWSDLWHEIRSQVEGVFQRGEASWNERVLLLTTRNGYPESAWFTFSYSPAFDEQSRIAGLLCVVAEETARVLSERRKAFLVEITDLLRTLTRSVDIISVVVAALGKYLKASRVAYGTILPDAETIVLEASYNDGVQPIAGSFRLTAFGNENIAQQRRGLTVFCDDIPTDSEAFEAWHALETRSFVSVPLVREGTLRAALYVTHREQRHWSREETALIEDVAGRLWEALERARAQEEEKKSEERLTFALEAGGGIGTWDHDVPADRLSCNARFARLFSVDPESAAAGAPMAEFLAAVHTDDRAMVSDKVGRAISTGGQYTAEYRVFSQDGSLRWLLARGRGELDATGHPCRFIGVVFDITDRKLVERRDAFLVRLDDVVRPLTDAQEITQAAARLLGQHLQVNRCAYADVEEDQNTFNLTGDYTRGVDSIVGRYTFDQFGAECRRLMREGLPFIVTDSETDPRTELVRASFRMTKIRSVICVPMMKATRFVAAMAVHQMTPRHWQADEVELLQQVASRCWESIERARIARELREREQRYRFLAESIPQMVWTAGPDGQLDYVSSQVTHYFGTDQAAVLGEGWLRWVHPDDVASTGERWMTSLRTGEPYEVSFRLLRAADHRWRWHLVRAQPLIGEGHRVVQWFGTCTDIEEQKQAQANLQQQWHTFDTALSHTPDFTYIFDLEGRFTYMNRGLLSLWQKTFEEMRGKNFFELGYPHELAARLQRQIQEVIQTREPVRDQTPFTGPNGEIGYHEYILVPVFAAEGHVEAVAGSTRDITERERMSRALAASEKKLQQVFAQAPVAIGVFRGHDFVAELANQPFLDLLYKRNVLGRRFIDVVPELEQTFWDAFNSVMDTGKPFIGNEFYIPYDQNGDGTVEDHWFNVAYHPLRDPDGVSEGIVAVCNEVTPQLLARRELERVNRELEEFAYVASHDLQEPLRMVNIYSHLLVKRFANGDSVAAQYAEFVSHGVGRMETLIRDLLTYSRTVQREEAPPGTADLTLALTEALDVLKGRIADTGALIAADPLPQTRGDTVQVAHVFQNLLSNALKYRKPEVAPRIHIGVRREAAGWLLSVQDNGIGFEQQYSERIFGLFKRLHKEEYPGTGLGLAICKRIIERFGGKMWAESIPGVGSTFWFLLPQADS